MGEVEDCTKLTGPLPGGVVYHPTGPCPVSGAMHCIGDFPDKACADKPDEKCGVAAAYVERCEQIHLPDQWDAGFAHEIIHHLLYKNGRKDWAEHSAPEFKCEVFRP